MSFSDVLSIILACLIMVVMILIVVYVYISYKNNHVEESNETNNQSEKREKEKTTSYTKIPVFDFMQFDKIEDNMIVQDGGARYLMVVECEGVNYDLMSEMEKAAVFKFFKIYNSNLHTN